MLRIYWSVVLGIIMAVSAVLYFNVFAADIQQGRDYLKLPSNPSTNTLQVPHKIKVIEFFSYACPACNKFEPYLDEWLSHKPANIIFERIPVLFQPDWVSYAKSYLALQELNATEQINHDIFTAVHSENLDLSDPAIMAEFLTSRGIDKSSFLKVYHSPSIDMMLSQNKKITSDYMVFQVPSLIIDGKYKVDPSFSGTDYHRLFDTVDYLIQQEKQEKRERK